MSSFLSLSLLLSILAGQLIKIPVGTHGGVTLLDINIGCLSLLGLWQRRANFQKPPLLIKVTLIFILIALVSLILTPLKLTISEYLTSFLYLVRFSFYVLFGWLVYQGIFPTIKQNLAKILLFSGVSLAILGLLQFLILPDLRFLEKEGWDPHFFRAAAAFLDPNFLGAYLVLTLILLVSLRGTLSDEAIFPVRLPQPLRGFAMTIVYLALLTTFSRGAYLAFLTGFATIAILKRSVRIGLFTLLLFAGLILGFTIYQGLIAQPRNIDRSQSAESRLNTWQQGLTLFTYHPILGVGFNAYRYALKQYNLGSDQFINSRGASFNDASLLHIATTTGIIGLTSFFSILAALAYSSWQIKQKSKWAIILLAGLTAVITQSFFTNNLFYPFIMIWIILVAVQAFKSSS